LLQKSGTKVEKDTYSNTPEHTCAQQNNENELLPSGKGAEEFLAKLKNTDGGSSGFLLGGKSAEEFLRARKGNCNTIQVPILSSGKRMREGFFAVNLPGFDTNEGINVREAQIRKLSSTDKQNMNMFGRPASNRFFDVLEGVDRQGSGSTV